MLNVKKSRLIALLLALYMMFSLFTPMLVDAEEVTTPAFEVKEDYALVKLFKNAQGIKLDVFNVLPKGRGSVSYEYLIYPYYEDQELAVYYLKPGGYTWKYARLTSFDGTTLYNVQAPFFLAEEDLGQVVEINADAGTVKATGFEISGLEVQSNFPEYAATITNKAMETAINVPLRQVTEQYFHDSRDFGPVDQDLLDMLGIDDQYSWGDDPWGRWANHGLVTPGFSPDLGMHEFASNEDILNFMTILDEYDNEKNGNDGKGVMHFYTAGQSELGTDIYFAIFSAEGVTTAEEALALERPVIFYQSQVHGNEYSPQEGALVNVIRLVTKELDVLDKVTILMCPRVNVDGAYAATRIPANSYNKDFNRDNFTFDNAESRVVHGEFIKFRPHFFLDAHEFSGNGQYTIDMPQENGETRAVQHMFSYDYELSSGKNFNIPQAVRDLTNEVIVPEVVAKLYEIGGYRMIEYTEQNRITGAGPVDPEAMKTLKEYKKDELGEFVLDDKGEKILQDSTNPSYENLNLSEVKGDYFRELMPNSRHSYDAHGLQIAANFLVEIRGLGIGKENWDRRVKTQADVCGEMIRWAAENDQLLLDTVNTAREEAIAGGAVYDDGGEVVLEVIQDYTEVRDFSMINLEDFSMTTLPISFWNTQKAIVSKSRPEPTAYILPKGIDFVIDYNGFKTSTDQLAQDIMKYNGAEVFEIAAGTELEVEQYTITSRALAANPVSFEGYPRFFVTVDTELASHVFENGAYVFPMDQLAGVLLKVSFEPDLDGSLFMFNKFGTDWQPGDVIPIYRFIEDNPRDVLDLEPLTVAE